MKLELLSEQYSAHGNISGEGIGKILGTPTHDRLRILVRETVQNTWDAKNRSEQAVYLIRLRKLSDSERSVLKESVFAERPKDENSSINASLQKEDLWVLDIIDEGTSGLGGPTRADKPIAHDEKSDFIDFVRNIGSPRDKEMGGGTYGYGKSSLYLMSNCQTICIHTLASFRSESSERFIACRIGDPFQVETGEGHVRHTGRHWWGQIEDHVVEPAENKMASHIAEGLGLPSRSFGNTGTSLMIIDPDLEHRNPEQAVNSIIETLMWYFWPKMISYEKKLPPMVFEAELNGSPIELPELNQYPPVHTFVRAMKKLKRGDSTEIWCRNPRKLLGHLAHAKEPIMKRKELDTGDAASGIESEIPERSSHVALMRPAELVVKYVSGHALPSDMVEYGGVFICCDDVEEIFARAEPPAHDDWIPGNLRGRQRTFVRMALKRINEFQDEWALGKGIPPGERSQDISLGHLSDMLGNLLVGIGGERLGGNGKQRIKASSKKGTTVSRPVPSGFEMIDDLPCALFKLEVRGTDRVSIRGVPVVILEGGPPTREPVGAEAPRLVRWQNEEGEFFEDPEIIVKTDSKATLVAAVTLVRDCAVELSVEVNTEKE